MCSMIRGKLRPAAPKGFREWYRNNASYAGTKVPSQECVIPKNASYAGTKVPSQE
jgi:hypothetical protein